MKIYESHNGWHIEYTNHPFVTKKRRKILEKAVAESIQDIKNHLKIVTEDIGARRILVEKNFYAELAYLPSLRKYHIAVRDLKRDEDWVATIIFDDQPTMTVKEVKRMLREMGFDEYSLYGLGVTNKKTVSEFIAELEENLSRTDREEWEKSKDLSDLEFLEAFLEKGVIKLSDGFLDAIRKIDRYIRS